MSSRTEKIKVRVKEAAEREDGDEAEGLVRGR